MQSEVRKRQKLGYDNYSFVNCLLFSKCYILQKFTNHYKSLLLPHDTNRLEFILLIWLTQDSTSTTHNKGDNKSDWTYTKYITLKLDTCVVTSVKIQ